MQVDLALIQDCISQKRRAQSKLYEKYFSLLMSVCLRYAKSESEAVSLLNNGFLKILNNLEKYKPEVPFEAWIRRVMINSIIDEYRKNKKHKEHIVYKEFQDFESNEGLVNYNEADRLLDAEQIQGLIRRLPPVSQKVFNLSVVDGYNHREIGEILGIAEGTSKWHLSFARKSLQEMIRKSINNLKTVLL